jgi:hypothetical protein
MARNGSGTYSTVNTFVAGNTITASGHNQNWADLASEMTNSVAADGQTSMTGPLKSANGTDAAPSISFASDPDSGFYRKAANSIAISLEGVDRVVFTTATATFSCAVSVPAKSFAISKIADGTANRLYGTDGSGVATEVTLGTGLSLSSSSLSATSALPRGYIDGLILSNGTDATNDIDIAAGKCRDSTDAVDIVIATALGKQLDANWAAGGTTGTPVGGRNSTAGQAWDDGTWHCYAVRTAASSAGDIYFHKSTTVATVLTALQAESGGTDYIYARRIGSITRSTSIRPFVQDGDEFLLKTPLNSYSSSNPGTSAVTYTVVGVPTGVKMGALLNGYARFATTGNGIYRVFSSDETDAAVDATNMTGREATDDYSSFMLTVRTNTSAQAKFRFSVSAGSDAMNINCRGWIDSRGKDA